MILRWSLVYVFFILTVVLGCLFLLQRARISAGTTSLVALEEQLNSQRDRLIEAEREARAAMDRLAEERRMRGTPEIAIAQAEKQIAELRKLKDESDERARRAQAELVDERQERQRLAAETAKTKLAASEEGVVRTEPVEAGSASMAVMAAEVTGSLDAPKTGLDAAPPADLPAAAVSHLPLPVRKPAPEIVGSISNNQDAHPVPASKPASAVTPAPTPAKPKAAVKRGSARQAKAKPRNRPSKPAAAEFFSY